MSYTGPAIYFRRKSKTKLVWTCWPSPLQILKPYSWQSHGR